MVATMTELLQALQSSSRLLLVKLLPDSFQSNFSRTPSTVELFSNSSYSRTPSELLLQTDSSYSRTPFRLLLSVAKRTPFGRISSRISQQDSFQTPSNCTRGPFQEELLSIIERTSALTLNTANNSQCTIDLENIQTLLEQ